MSKPTIYDDPLYQLLRAENISAFNQQRSSLDTSKLSSGDYRGLDLREMNCEGLDFTNGYFRSADLRGVDFRNTYLEGASFCEAKISGCYFPKEISAAEMQMSVERGTRIRYKV